MELIYGLPGGSVPSAPSFLERGASRASVRGPQWRSPSRFRPKNTIVQGFTLIGCLLAASFSRGGKFHTAQVSVLMVFCGLYFPLPLLFVLSTFRLLSILFPSRRAGGGGCKQNGRLAEGCSFSPVLFGCAAGDGCGTQKNSMFFWGASFGGHLSHTENADWRPGKNLAGAVVVLPFQRLDADAFAN